MKEIVTGMKYTFGVLVMCTAWSVIALGVINWSTEHVAQKFMGVRAAAQDESDRLLLTWGPDNDADRARLEHLNRPENRELLEHIKHLKEARYSTLMEGN